jgi:hypothetical protein
MRGDVDQSDHDQRKRHQLTPRSAVIAAVGLPPQAKISGHCLPLSPPTQVGPLSAGEMVLPHAGQRTSEKFAVDYVEDESQHDRLPLLNSCHW